MTNYKEKIQKLLALTTSPNEHEALVAAKKARELMAKHHIEMCDLKEYDPKRNVICKKVFPETVFERDLMCQVFMKMRCECAYSAISNHIYNGKKCAGVVFVYGYEDDVDVAEQLGKYLFQAGVRGCMRAKNEYKTTHPNEKLYGFSHNYEHGFIVAVVQAFEEQNKENKGDQAWGLILLTPEEVKKAMKAANPNLRVATRKASSVRNDATHAAISKGIADGKSAFASKGRKELE